MKDFLLRYGPVILVPAAWTVVAMSHFERLFGTYELLIAHVVMVTLMILFMIAGWKQMESNVLRIWRNLILIGIPATVSGVLGLSVLQNIEFLNFLSIFYWMVSPGIALILTGRFESVFDRTYRLAGALSVLGAVFYILPYFTGVNRLSMVMVSIVAVGTGQTLGIILAAYQNSNSL